MNAVPLPAPTPKAPTLAPRPVPQHVTDDPRLWSLTVTELSLFAAVSAKLGSFDLDPWPE